MASPSKLKAALKVGVLDNVLHVSLGDRLREIPTTHSTPFPEAISSRSQRGAIEKEASRLARMAVGWCSRVISKSADKEA
ncbi:uncharacterized protein BDW43DRAFT_315784 [Aspergillus alliaceus]|uniref:uncharacterized protein n=1 Tax=Petromyces alliaceus TaxID=209559 RepID=UPI0012A5D854|nr:uncharacterized protein BDW43DRAFT_315784 [Aspergillus alliaceus]KAB8228564.1 hypothetical protein BDW43DRAFT_315784 [Aspergillus alliaceus]